jgi:putative glutamine amidotransferase
VNSGHHQAVDVVAPALTVSARSADGCIEALESAQLLVMSVQWHPDEMRSVQTSHRLMAGFAEWMGR